MTQLSLEQKKQWYGENLLQWYHPIKRDLPWRHNHDPYRIWVSEIMLQQTRVDTVIPYFNNFISKFPTVKHLAEAPEEEVLKCWEGLGYYSRARNLQAGAKMVMELYHGTIPSTKDDVAALKGVGPYTCGAIMSIAYNEPIPAVDGNVMRVISRFFALEDDIAKSSTRIKLEKLVETMIPTGEARYFNQALMELGALICTPKSPSCLLCPVMDNCEARLEGREHELPIKSKAKKARVEYRVAVIVEGNGEYEGKILVRQRPAEGLLAGMWELPHVLVSEEQVDLFQHSIKEQPQLGRMIAEDVHTRHDLLIKPRQWFCDQEHIFSHIRWNMRFFIADRDPEQHAQHSSQPSAIGSDTQHTTLSGSGEGIALVAEQGGAYPLIDTPAQNEDELRFITEQDMDSLPFPNLFLKIIQKYWQGKSKGDI
jgi:A/G-specific adenine glycosylase